MGTILYGLHVRVYPKKWLSYLRKLIFHNLFPITHYDTIERINILKNSLEKKVSWPLMMTTNNSMKRRLTVEHIIVRASMVKIIYSSLLSNDRMRCWNWKNIAQKCPSHAQHNLSTSIKNNNPFCVGFFPIATNSISVGC